MFKRKLKQVMPNIPSVKVALILDETILDVLHVDERLGAILLSNPLVINVTEVFQKTPEKASKLINAKYDEDTEVITPISGE
jgi:hypothetical protein